MDRGLFHAAFAKAMNALRDGFQVTERGIAGPEGALIRLGERHPSRSEGHVDIEVVLNERAATPVGFTDCVTGIGATDTARAAFAAHLWARTTGCALLELKYSRKGEYADHYRGWNELGFTGWHAIAAPILGYGHAVNADRLQHWWLDHSLLPMLSRELSPELGGDTPHGIKILFGGDDVAEIRVDGEPHEAASSALRELDWPRSEPAAFVRSYVMLLHRE